MSAIETTPGSSPVTGLGFSGLSEQSVPPPDVQIAAGRSQLAEMVNLELGVWTKAGSPVGAPVPLSLLFGTGGDHIGDPRVLFDPSSGRWFSSLVDVSNDSVYLGVSASSDITGVWWFYRFAIPGCPDQPRLGVDDSQLLISVNLLTACTGGSDEGSRVVVITKSDLLAGQTTNTQIFGSSGLFGISPAQTVGSNPTGWMASLDHHDSTTLHVYGVTGLPPHVAVTQHDISLSTAVQDAPNAPQPTGPPIDTGDNRLQDAAWQNGSLFLSFNDACTSPEKGLQSCAAVAAVSTSGTASLLWRHDFAPLGQYAYYPAVRPDPDGNLLISFGASSASQYPSGAVAAVKNDGTLTPTYAPIQTGSHPIENDRFGDYFGAAIDPVDPHVIWTAAEVGNNASGEWGTAIRAASVDGNPWSVTAGRSTAHLKHRSIRRRRRRRHK